MKKVYVSETEDPRRARWKDRVKEYMQEKVADRGEGSVWIGRGGGSSAVAITPERHFRRERGITNYR